MPSITPMMSAIFCELSVMPSIVATTWPTTSPPRAATARRACSASCAGAARGVGVVLDGGGELLHRRRRLLQVARLLLGALAQVGVAVGDLRRSRWRSIRTRCARRRRWPPGCRSCACSARQQRADLVARGRPRCASRGRRRPRSAATFTATAMPPVIERTRPRPTTSAATRQHRAADRQRRPQHDGVELLRRVVFGAGAVQLHAAPACR